MSEPSSGSGVDLATIDLRQRAVRRAETRRSVAAMLVATCSLGALIALDPFTPPSGVAPAGLGARIAALPTAPRAEPAPTTPSPAPVVTAPSEFQPPKIQAPEIQPPRAARMTQPADQLAALPPAAAVPSAVPSPEATPPDPIAEVPREPSAVPPAVQGPATLPAADIALADPPDNHLQGAPAVTTRQASLPPAVLPVAPAPATSAPAASASAAPPPQILAFATAATAPASPLPPVGARDATPMRKPSSAAEAADGPPTPPAAPHLPADDLASEPDFEQRLVLAAHDLTRIPGGYDPRYMKIAYPMGDVPEGMGVCSDVIVRAYRGLGIDLQELVHQARLGTGDTNVDHRRVQVLSRFFQRFGASLPPSPFPESYKPGDIVAYDVPWGRTSKWHIAIVTDRLSPSLRPMVVHNRGYGAKLEDALFHKRIIGHYRFTAANMLAMPATVRTTRTAADGKAQRRAVARIGGPRS